MTRRECCTWTSRPAPAGPGAPGLGSRGSRRLRGPEQSPGCVAPLSVLRLRQEGGSRGDLTIIGVVLPERPGAEAAGAVGGDLPRRSSVLVACSHHSAGAGTFGGSSLPPVTLEVAVLTP